MPKVNVLVVLADCGDAECLRCSKVLMYGSVLLADGVLCCTIELSLGQKLVWVLRFKGSFPRQAGRLCGQVAALHKQCPKSIHTYLARPWDVCRQGGADCRKHARHRLEM